MACVLVWTLQAPISTKAHVVLAFSFRLLFVDAICCTWKRADEYRRLLVPIAMRLAAFPAWNFASDPTLGLCLFAVWTQTELICSLVSATIPSLPSFLRGLSTADSTIFGSSIADPKQPGFSIMLSDLSRNRRVTDRKSPGEATPEELFLRPAYEDGSHNMTVRGSVGRKQQSVEQDSVSVGSDDSQGMIIRREVTWTLDAGSPSKDLSWEGNTQQHNLGLH